MNPEKDAKPCIFIGYSYAQKAYKKIDLSTKKFFTSRDVIFLKKLFSIS
jgi:hypothetical protein